MTGILLAAVGNSYGSKPLNTVAPAVTGTAQVRQTLSCSTGTWTASPPSITYTYQWKANGSPISGATSSTYLIAVAYVGQSISCDVTATNIVGSTTASSNSTAAVAANVPAAPTIGTATATGSSTATVSYTAPADNGGATITSYTAVSTPGSITGTLNTAGSGTITVSGLSPNTSYTFRVYATNSVGNSALSNASNSITTQDAYWFASVSGGYENYIGAVAVSNGNPVFNVYTSTGAPNYYPSTGYVSLNSGTGAVVWAKVYGGTASTRVSFTSYPIRIYSDGSNLTTVAYDPGNLAQYAYRVNSSGDLITQYRFSLTTPAGVNDFNGSTGFGYNGSDYYVTGRSQNGYPFISKFNSSGTAQWSKYTNSNTLGISFRWAEVAPNGSVYVLSNYGTANFSSSGALNYAWKYEFGGGNTNSVDPRGCVTDSSSNLYVAAGCQVSGGGYAPTAFKLNTSGVPQWVIGITTSVGSCSFVEVAKDSSNNLYFVGNYPVSGIGTLGVILKTDLNGNVVWGRQIRADVNTSTSSVNLSGVALNSAGTIMYVTTSFMTGYSTPVVFKLPTDGSKTGTYGNVQYANLAYGVSSFTSTYGNPISMVDGVASGAGVSLPTTSISPTSTVTNI